MVHLKGPWPPIEIIPQLVSVSTHTAQFSISLDASVVCNYVACLMQVNGQVQVFVDIGPPDKPYRAPVATVCE